MFVFIKLLWCPRASCYLLNFLQHTWRTRRNNKKRFLYVLGQFICGEKRCDEKEHLRSWEVLFGYVEHGKKRDALVKLRLCPSCTKKLHFGHKVKEIVPKEKESEPEVTEIDESASVQKKSRLDTDDDTTTIPDDGKMWSQPLAEA
ncbi:unnamed protein product, partial [Rotaria magnacalcarata]